MLKKISINLPFEQKEMKDKDGKIVEPTPIRDMTANYISYAVSRAHEKGLDSDKRRIYAKVQRKLDEAIDAGADFILLNDYEHSFLRSAFDKVSFPAPDSMNAVMVEDALLEAKSEEEQPSVPPATTATPTPPVSAAV